MRLTKDILWRTGGRKIITLLLIAVSTVAAFATLGDGKSKKSNSSLLNKPVAAPGKFSLKSGYQYRGSQIINQNRMDQTITLNSLVTYQKGHMTYIIPVKTKVNTSKVKFGVGIPQLNK